MPASRAGSGRSPFSTWSTTIPRGTRFAVPACWQTAGHRYNGVAWYRTRFDYEPDGANNVIRLLFKGVDYFADAWLNLLLPRLPRRLLPPLLVRRLALDQAGREPARRQGGCPKPEAGADEGGAAGHQLGLQRPDPGSRRHLERRTTPRPAATCTSEDLKVTPFIDLARNSARVLCRATLCNTTPDIKKVFVTATPVAAQSSPASRMQPARRWSCRPASHRRTCGWTSMRRGCGGRGTWGRRTRTTWPVSVTDEAGELDRVGDRIGLRHLRKEHANGWEIYLNGKRIFCRGPNYVSEQLQSTMTRARYEFDVQLMKDANMNMVRSYCVVEREEFYDVCDEKDVMVYQDFPTTGRMSNRGDVVRRAVQQGRRMVNQLYHHPSIVLWSWGSQPAVKNFEKLCLALATACAEEDPHRFIQQGASVWQWRTAKDKFDWPIDFHLLAGWFHPDDRFGPFLMMERDECNSGYSVEELNIKRKELLEFVSEYGPPEALPDLPSLERIIPEADRWPVNWEAYGQRWPARRHPCAAGSASPDSLEQLIRDNQEYRAFHLKYHTEFYRRHKFRPCNGALFFQFKDCWPAVTAAVVDYYGRPKRAYYTLRQACNPIHVLMDWPPLAGEPRRLDVPQGPVRGQRLPPPLPRPAPEVADPRRFRLAALRARIRLQHPRPTRSPRCPTSSGPSRRPQAPATASPSS